METVHGIKNMDSLKQAESNHHCFSVLKLALASVVREQHEHLLWCYKSEWTSQTSGGNFITLNFFLHWRIGNMLSQKDIMCLDWFSLSTIITIVYLSKQSFPNLSSSLLSHISWGGFFHILVSNWPLVSLSWHNGKESTRQYRRCKKCVFCPRLEKILWSKK